VEEGGPQLSRVEHEQDKIMPLCITSNTLLKSERNVSEQDQALLDGTEWTRVASENDSTQSFSGFSGITKLEDNHRLGREVVGQIRDGLSIIERSETAARSVAGIVLRMRELAIHACSDTFEGSKRRLVAAATVQFREQLDSISSVTKYNGIQLANGSNTMLSVQAGTYSSDQDRISIPLADLGASSLFHGKRIDLSTVTGSRSALDTFDSALETIRVRRQNWKASHHELDGALNRLRENSESNAVTDTRIVGSDFALEAAILASEQVKLASMQAVNAQLCAITKGVFQLLG
jgi:flagellin